VTWALEFGVIEQLERTPGLRVEDLVVSTALTEAGVDSLLGVLSAMSLVHRNAEARYALTGRAREYLLECSPFYIGDQLPPGHLPLPRPYLKQNADWLTRLKLRLMAMRPAFRFGSPERLANQHVRNLGACSAAAASGEFAGTRCLVDVAGGSGAFAIPLALAYPGMRIILGEVGPALRNISPFLVQHGVQNRVELLGMDALSRPWNIPECDGIFIGNFIHGFDDECCRNICRESLERLQPGGRLWIHELVWNADRNGPLTTALWHAAMRGVGSGRQRTAAEICSILASSGFDDIRARPTSGSFELISGRKRA
jgi:precorrin-6B methylase 2